MNKNNIVSGIIGAFVGGFIASIPWILMYVYGNMILSLLAIIIAAGALIGYQKFNGVIDEKLPIIITIVSLLVVTIATLVIIPLLLIANEGGEVTLDNLIYIYQYNEFTAAIIKDYIISIIFTILGISGVISNVKKQLRDNPEATKINIYSENDIAKEIKQIQLEVRETFESLNALTKNTAVEKNTILEKMTVSNPKLEFNNLKTQQIIRKYKGKYYFSDAAASSFWYRFLSLYLKLLIVAFIIIIILVFL